MALPVENKMMFINKIENCNSLLFIYLFLRVITCDSALKIRRQHYNDQSYIERFIEIQERIGGN